MKVEFSAFPKAFSGNVAVFVGADKQLHASATAIDGTLGGAVVRAIAAGRFNGAKNQTLSVLGQANFPRLLLLGVGKMVPRLGSANRVCSLRPAPAP